MSYRIHTHVAFHWNPDVGILKQTFTQLEDDSRTHIQTVITSTLIVKSFKFFPVSQKAQINPTTIIIHCHPANIEPNINRANKFSFTLNFFIISPFFNFILAYMKKKDNIYLILC